MTASTNALETALVNHVYRNVTYTSPAAVYMALLTGPAGDSGAQGSELTGLGGYARLAITFGAPVNGVSVNTNELLWTASADWGLVSHFAIADALTVGTYLSHGGLSVGVDMNNGDVIKFPAGSIFVAFT